MFVEWRLESPLTINSYSVFILGIPPMMSLFTHMMIVAVSVYYIYIMKSHEAFSYSEYTVIYR